MSRSAFWIQRYEEALDRGVSESAAVDAAQQAIVDRHNDRADHLHDQAKERDNK